MSIYIHPHTNTHIHACMHNRFHPIPFHSIPFHSIPFHSISSHYIRGQTTADGTPTYTELYVYYLCLLTSPWIQTFSLGCGGTCKHTITVGKRRPGHPKRTTSNRMTISGAVAKTAKTHCMIPSSPQVRVYNLASRSVHHGSFRGAGGWPPNLSSLGVRPNAREAFSDLALAVSGGGVRARHCWHWGERRVLRVNRKGDNFTHQGARTHAEIQANMALIPLIIVEHGGCVDSRNREE